MDNIKNYLEKHHNRFVRELCDYIRFPSISSEARCSKGIMACAKWLVAHCRAIGLESELYATSGNPVVIVRTSQTRTALKPHYLVYGHYDVQPAAPLELWRSPPFQPLIRGNSIFGRGASDNKGQHFAHLKAVEAYLKTGTDLPCDLTFVIEGEEEIGSPSLAAFLRTHKSHLACDAVVISDTQLHSPAHPTLSYGLRGICGLELTLRGPNRDVHSGVFGGTINNPAMALCQMLGQLRDQQGCVTIPGFYSDVAALSAFERAQFMEQPFDAGTYRQLLGVPELFGESGFSIIEQRGARPTLEINGLTSGYQGAGSQTIVPSSARAKITMRLVPHQEPKKILALATSHLRRICPPSVRLEVKTEHGGDPYWVSPESKHVQAALEALRRAFNCEPLLTREGGSIPIVNQFKRILKADSLLLGLALPDDNAHSPNEKFSLEMFNKGILMSAHLWQQLPRQNLY